MMTRSASPCWRELLSFLPSNNLEDAPRRVATDSPTRKDAELDSIIPSEPTQPYDIKEVITRIVDDAYFFEVQEHFARNIVIGFARMDGRSVGIVANQPMHLAGVLDIAASSKAARFVRFCDAFNIPLITLEDVPGFLPGTQQEYGGIIRHGAKLLYAYAEATVPKLTVITRKSLRRCLLRDELKADSYRREPGMADRKKLAVMGAEGAVNIVYGRELEQGLKDAEASEGPLTEERRASLLAAARKEKIDEFRQRFSNPYIAAERGYVDAVILPRETRPHLIRALAMLEGKRDKNPPKKHGNIPL